MKNLLFMTIVVCYLKKTEIKDFKSQTEDFQAIKSQQLLSSFGKRVKMIKAVDC